VEQTSFLPQLAETVHALPPLLLLPPAGVTEPASAAASGGLGVGVVEVVFPAGLVPEVPRPPPALVGDELAGVVPLPGLEVASGDAGNADPSCDSETAAQI
jgi:hypothetical protein